MYQFIVIPINKHGFRTQPCLIFDNKFKWKHQALKALKKQHASLIQQTMEKYKDKMCMYSHFDIALLKDRKKEVQTFIMKWEEKQL